MNIVCYFSLLIVVSLVFNLSSKAFSIDVVHHCLNRHQGRTAWKYVVPYAMERPWKTFLWGLEEIIITIVLLDSKFFSYRLFWALLFVFIDMSHCFVVIFFWLKTFTWHLVPSPTLHPPTMCLSLPFVFPKLLLDCCVEWMMLIVDWLKEGCFCQLLISSTAIESDLIRNPPLLLSCHRCHFLTAAPSPLQRTGIYSGSADITKHCHHADSRGRRGSDHAGNLFLLM